MKVVFNFKIAFRKKGLESFALLKMNFIEKFQFIKKTYFQGTFAKLRIKTQLRLRYMSKRAYGHRLLLSSRRLVRHAADDDFDITKKKGKGTDANIIHYQMKLIKSVVLKITSFGSNSPKIKKIDETQGFSNMYRVKSASTSLKTS